MVRLAVLAGVPVSFGIGLVAPDIVGLIFGPTFEDSVPLLRLRRRCS